jgi:uncharacterized protein with FMN-binding domain
MKAKGLKIFLMVLASVIVTITVPILIALPAGTAGMDEVRAYRIPAIDLGRIADGTYEGACDIGRFAVTVNVAVKGHLVTGVEIADKRQSNVNRELAAALNKRVIGKEKPDFDAVTGASITGKAYLIAVADALKKGMIRIYFK